MIMLINLIDPREFDSLRCQPMLLRCRNLGGENDIMPSAV